MLTVFLSACGGPKIALSDFQDRPAMADFKIADLRPEKEKHFEILSFWVTSCDYGIYRYGDESIIPSSLVFLRRNLEDALGDRLRGRTLTVTRYTIYLNKRVQLRQTVNGAFTGIVPQTLNEAGNGCTKKDTGDAWFDASEVTNSNPPFIIQIEASMDSKLYSVRTVFSTPDITAASKDPSGNSLMFDAMHKANDALLQQLQKDLPPTP